jgi:hypothetical protein
MNNPWELAKFGCVLNGFIKDQSPQKIFEMTFRDRVLNFLFNSLQNIFAEKSKGPSTLQEPVWNQLVGQRSAQNGQTFYPNFPWSNIPHRPLWSNED